MALLARQMASGFLPLDLRQLVLAAVPELRGGSAGAGGHSSTDMLTVRSLASVGLTGLFVLPLLMLASIILHAPFAIPAAISLGYLAAARALASDDIRRATGWSFAIPCGFVAWTMLLLLTGDGPLSRAGLAAILLGPLFSVAPALARRFLAMPDPARAAALDAVACLDRLAPSESVLFVERSGALLAGTHAGLTRLGLHPYGAVDDITRAFDLADRPALLNALARCRTGTAPAAIALRVASAIGTNARHVAATLVAGQHEAVTLRLDEQACAESERIQAERTDDRRPAPRGDALAGPTPCSFRCDARGAIRFAMRHVGPKAKERGAFLVAEGGAVMAACDPRTLRRVLIMLTESAVSNSRRGGEVCVSARRLKGTVLLRVSVETERDGEAAARLRSALHRSGVGEMVDHSGGTLIVEESLQGARMSVRLALADAQVADRGARQVSGAS